MWESHVSYSLTEDSIPRNMFRFDPSLPTVQWPDSFLLSMITTQFLYLEKTDDSELLHLRAVMSKWFTFERYTLRIKENKKPTEFIHL